MENSAASPMNEDEPNSTGSISSGLEKKLYDLGIYDESESDDEIFLGNRDEQLLAFRIGWTGNSDDPSQQQLHQVNVDKSDGIKSDFVKFLKKIGCEDRYAARSVEFPNVFFAWLTEDEAVKLEGVEGVNYAISCTYMVFHH